MDAITLILIPFIAYGAKYTFNILLAHSLSIEMYGDFALGLKTLAIFSSCILLGTATSAKRFLSTFLKVHDDTTSIDYIQWNLHLILKFSVIALCILLMLSLTMITLHILHIKPIHTYHIAFYLLYISPLCALAALMASYLQCNGNNNWSNLCTQGGAPILYASTFFLITYFFHFQFNFNSLWVLALFVFIILNILEFSIIKFYFSPHFIQKILAYRSFEIQKVLPAWKKTAQRLIVNQLVFLTLCIVDLYAVKFCVKDTTAVGQYSAMLSISAFLWLLGNSIYSMITAHISPMLEAKDICGLQKIVTHSVKINAISTTIVMLAIIFFGKTILSTFGAHYATDENYTALVILALGYYLGSFVQPATSLLAYSGNELCLVYGSLLELTCITISAILLTLLYGITGTAIASTLTIVLKTIGYIVIARQKTSIKSLGFM